MPSFSFVEGAFAPIMFHDIALPGLIALFLGAAVIVWVAGIRLSTTTDVLDERFHLG